MDFYSKIDENRNLFLTKIFEPEENSLTFHVSLGEVLPYTKHEINGIEFEAGQIIHHEQSEKFKITFPSYIAYCVLNESYDHIKGQFTGNSIRVYSSSNFLKYIEADTIASSHYPGEFKHYVFSCENHLINVVSTAEPIILELE